MTTPEVNELRKSGYNPLNYYNNNPELRKVLDFISNGGIEGKDFSDISARSAASLIDNPAIIRWVRRLNFPSNQAPPLLKFVCMVAQPFVAVKNYFSKIRKNNGTVSTYGL